MKEDSDERNSPRSQQISAGAEVREKPATMLKDCGRSATAAQNPMHSFSLSHTVSIDLSRV